MILGWGVAAERSSGVGGGERIDDEDDPSFAPVCTLSCGLWVISLLLVNWKK
jgi:hypothetical protein